MVMSSEEDILEDVRSSKKNRRKSKKHMKKATKPYKVSGRLMKYAATGSLKKLTRTIDKARDVDVDINTQDSHGDTPMHHACRSGHIDIARVLLAAGADLGVRNSQGSTPVHVAALTGQLSLLLLCLRAQPAPDIDVRNNAGQTVRQLAERFTDRHDEEADVGASAADEMRWEERLAMEHSDDEGGGLFAGAWSEAPAAPGESNDQWADRLWKEMANKRRQEREKAIGEWQALHAQERRRQKLQEEAASNSARILREEAARDAAWRRGVLEGAAGGAPVAAAALRTRAAALEAKWIALETADQDAVIRFEDVPWVVSVGRGGGRRQLVGPLPPGAPSEVESAADEFKSVVLLGVDGVDDVKRRLRREILRWHPDKFLARFGKRLRSEDMERIMVGVQMMSRLTTELMQGK